MGISIVYKERWIDPRMDFSPEELRDFEPEMMARARLDWLAHHVQVIERYLEDPSAPMRDWWKPLSARMIELTFQYSRAAFIGEVDRVGIHELPAPDSAAGHALAVEAQKLNAEQFMNEWDHRVRRSITVFASKANKWIDADWGGQKKLSKKGKTSLCNKILNAMEQDIALMERKELSLAPGS